ncbi:helix-turn-helix domain-containing protein [Streptomyces xanthochromogenes]|uniref:helix-turn-helix domain-containing protein n=1 Tax=Streptomyces xanthochromogenes TaxID=67384 RepID=UPI00380D0F5C
MTEDRPSPHTPETFARWLRDQLSARGYSERGGQQRFAKDSGISPATVSRLLRADGLPDLRTLQVLAEALGLTLGEILVRSGVASQEELAAAARPITPDPISAEQAATELGISEPQAVAAFVAMVNALRPSRDDGDDQRTSSS